MTDAELVQYFDYFLQNYQIQTQIMQRAPKLYMMLNRPGDLEIDYPFLTEALLEQLRTLSLDRIETVVFNSRPIGERTSDWKLAVALWSTAVADPPPSPPEPQPTPPGGSQPRDLVPAPPPEPPTESEASPPALCSYCFVRNSLLVKTTLPDPAPEVAEAIQIFHEMPPERQLQVAPVLVEFFKRPDTDELEHLPEDLQTWLLRIQALNEQKLKSVAVWLSRYCVDADQAMAQVNATLQILAPQRMTASSPAASGNPGEAQDPAKGTAASPHPSTAPTGSSTRAPSGERRQAATQGGADYYRRPAQSPAASREKPAWQQLALPVIGICLAVMVIFSGVWLGGVRGSRYCHQPSTQAAPDLDRYHLCLFASDLLGEEDLPFLSETAVRLDPTQLQQALVPGQCLRTAVESSEYSFIWGDPVEQTYRMAEVMPGLYGVDLLSTFRGGSRDLLRYGCVYKGLEGGRVSLLDSDYLPETWPDVRYRPSSRRQQESLGNLAELTPMMLLSRGGILAILLVLVLFVGNLLITSLSFYFISRLGLGIQVYSLPDLMLGSLVFTIWRSTLSFIPGIGFLFQFALDIFALLLTAWLVKGFRVDYSAGYPLLMLSVLLLFAIRFGIWLGLVWMVGPAILSMLAA